MIIFGNHQEKTLDQIMEVGKVARRVALMGDGHLGYFMPIGGVAAYLNQVSVLGVGYDIGCGNLAVKTDINIGQVARASLEGWADTINEEICFGVGGVNISKDAPRDHPLLHDPRWDIIPSPLRETLREKARDQLGTVGSGNHFVDIFTDEGGEIWIGVHFGSRGLGHQIASSFTSLQSGGGWTDRGVEGPTLLDLDTQLGKDYWELMQLAGDYARAGREWVVGKVLEILGGNTIDTVHNHHNYAWKEDHGEELIVVRKGATPAFPGQRGFVGGSMGDVSVILEGVDTDLARVALYSTIHGAGRVMSRSEAVGKVAHGAVTREGRVTRKMMNQWVDALGVILRGGGLDESPHVYRRLPEVLDAQKDTIRVLHTLRPLIVIMDGDNGDKSWK
jgi:tRNA-splicing ligase RtcB (3'-phosphate/5'-hydroxy nucleic acid ligase)